MARPKKQVSGKSAKEREKKKGPGRGAPGRKRNRKKVIPPKPVLPPRDTSWIRRGDGAPETESWKDMFLDIFASSGNVSLSVDRAGVSLQAAYQAKNKDPWFSAKWKEAQDRFVDLLREVAVQRAAWKSDYLLLALLKAKAPDEFGDKTKMEMSGVMGSVNVQAGQEEMVTERGREQLLQIIGVLQKRLQEGQGATSPDQPSPPDESKESESEANPGEIPSEPESGDQKGE